MRTNFQNSQITEEVNTKKSEENNKSIIINNTFQEHVDSLNNEYKSDDSSDIKINLTLNINFNLKKRKVKNIF